MDKKKEKQSVVQLIRGFMQRANGDHVGAYAAQAAYFLIISAATLQEQKNAWKMLPTA